VGLDPTAALAAEIIILFLMEAVVLGHSGWIQVIVIEAQLHSLELERKDEDLAGQSLTSCLGSFWMYHKSSHWLAMVLVLR
jgi:hypothetical protein